MEGRLDLCTDTAALGPRLWQRSCSSWHVAACVSRFCDPPRWLLWLQPHLRPTHRWEALDRSLRRVDAVLNEAARSTGLELDRVCDGSVGGMLGGLTQMPPSLEQHYRTPFEVEAPDEVVIGDEDCTAAGRKHQAPSPGGVGRPSQQERLSGSPRSSGCADHNSLPEDPPQSPADSLRHPQMQERSEHGSPSCSVRQATVAASLAGDVAEASPRHTPREEWTLTISSGSSQEASPRQTPEVDSHHQAPAEACAVQSQPEPDLALAEATAVGTEPDPDVWFEVSPNTGRVHLHAAADGTEPFGLSIPIRSLLARNDPEPVLEELFKAVKSRSGALATLPA